MSKKEYPLDVVSCGRDEYIMMSYGHHDIHEFMKAVRAEGYSYQLGVPEHRFARAVPDSTGEFNHLFIFSKEGGRGAFPVTYAWEASPYETYESIYPEFAHKETDND